MAALMEGLVKLADCPIGLFECMGELCLKTAYGNNEGRIDSYIVSSGEFFWGPSPQSIANQRACMVRPVSLDRLAHSEPRPVAGEGLYDFLETVSAPTDWDGSWAMACSSIWAKWSLAATHSPAPTEAGEVERARTIARHMVEACGELANSTRYDAADRALWGSAEADAQEIFDLLSSTHGGAEG